MRNFKLSMETVGNCVKTGCKIVGTIFVVLLPYLPVKDIMDMIRFSGKVGYGDAVEVIMSSSMYSGDKNEAMSMLSKDGDSEYYKAVVCVMKSGMYSSDKLEAIKNINENS